MAQNHHHNLFSSDEEDDDFQWKDHSFFPTIERVNADDQAYELDEFGLPLRKGVFQTGQPQQEFIQTSPVMQNGNRRSRNTESAIGSGATRSAVTRKRSRQKHEVDDEVMLHDNGNNTTYYGYEPYDPNVSSDAEIARHLQDEEYQAKMLPPAPRDGRAGATGRNVRADPSKRKSRMEIVDDRLRDPRVRKQLKKFKKKPAYFVWIISLAQIIMAIALFPINANLTGSIIETDPFNFMIGPSALTLIRTGARFVPCMKNETEFQNAVIRCPSGFSANNQCTIQDLCGGPPDQWWRFIVPIFLHGGLLHLAINLSFQLTTVRQMENDFGWWRIAGIYFLSGIFGFIFGGNFAAASVPSVGCSGALFGFISCLMIDLIQNWYIIVDPWKQLIKFIVMIFLSFLMGVLPGVDNFSHIGGFFMGIFACLLFMPTIHFNKWDRRRKRIMRIIAIPIIIILYTVLLVTFYRNTADDVCPWCKYISCFGIKALCDFQNLQP